LLTIGISYMMLIPAHSQMVPLLSDDFEDGVIHPDWVVSTSNTVNPFYMEQGGSLQVVTIPAEHVGANEWCWLQFTRPFQPASDFESSFEIGWDSNGSGPAMQGLNVVLYNPLGTEVARAGYYDGNSDLPGRFWAGVGGQTFTGPDLPLAGTSLVTIVRTNDELRVSFDGSLKLTANVKSPIVRVAMQFSHWTWSGGSTFGRLNVRDVNLAGKLDVSAITPHVAAELEWLGAIEKTYDILASGDLETWIPVETGIPGENKIIYRLISTRALREQHGWKRVFYKYEARPD